MKSSRRNLGLVIKIGGTAAAIIWNVNSRKIVSSNRMVKYSGSTIPFALPSLTKKGTFCSIKIHANATPIGKAHSAFSHLRFVQKSMPNTISTLFVRLYFPTKYDRTRGSVLALAPFKIHPENFQWISPFELAAFLFSERTFYRLVLQITG